MEEEQDLGEHAVLSCARNNPTTDPMIGDYHSH